LEDSQPKDQPYYQAKAFEHTNVSDTYDSTKKNYSGKVFFFVVIAFAFCLSGLSFCIHGEKSAFSGFVNFQSTTISESTMHTENLSSATRHSDRENFGDASSTASSRHSDRQNLSMDSDTVSSSHSDRQNLNVDPETISTSLSTRHSDRATSTKSVDDVLPTIYTPPHFEIESCLEDEVKDYRTLCCSNSKLSVMGGIDVVQIRFQDEGSLPVLGNPDFSALLITTSGAWVFQFVSEENRNTFLQDPWKYAPAWGGYCAYGIAFEDKSFNTDFVNKLGPYVNLGVWLVYNDRLFFFGGDGVRTKFLADADQGIKLGDLHWMSFYNTDTAQDGHFDTNCFHEQTYEDLSSGVQSSKYDHKSLRNSF